MHKLACLCCVALTVVLFGCQSTVDPIEADLTPEQYFQEAIEAVDVNNYRLAMEYYKAFLAKYPDDVERGLWASYEIAFLNYKMGNEEEAIELFDQLIERYAREGEDAGWPRAPLVLARKVRGNILEQQRRDNEEA